MSALPSSLPTIREELDRKVFETLDWLTTSVRKCRITEEQFSMGIDTLFMAVSGLVDKDFINIITEAQNQCQHAKSVVRRLYQNAESGEVIVYAWKPGSSEVVVTKKILGEAVKGLTKDFDTPNDAYEFFAKDKPRDWVEL